MKMKKNSLTCLSFILILVLIATVFTIPVYAIVTDRIWDEAELLADYEIEELEATIEEVEDETGWNILVATTNDTEGRSAMEYADDCYDACYGINTDGLAIAVDMGNRKVHISTSGDALYTLSDGDLENIIDAGYEDLKDGYYLDCFKTMLEKAAWYKRTGGHEITTFEKVLAVIAAVVAFLAVFIFVSLSYTSSGQAYKYNYVQNGRINLRRSKDDFMFESVHRERIVRESSSGSGSHSSHTSSSGGTHGGAGRSF